MQNMDLRTVQGFGRQWKQYNQRSVSENELKAIYERYFKAFPWDKLPRDAIGFDLGCGTGRWAKFVAKNVGKLHCVEPSEAIDVARENLKDDKNCVFHRAGVADMPIENSSMDFGYALGVFHYIPDAAAGIKACASKLKKGAPFLLYVYYALDGRPFWFRWIWRGVDLCRKLISRGPYNLRSLSAMLIASFIYLPAAKIALILERLGVDVENIPLATYRKYSFYTMRTDALDRFGNRIENRYSAEQIRNMMKDAGLIQIEVYPPYWCAIGYKA